MGHWFCVIAMAALLAGPAKAADMPYGVATWPENLGTQRARVRVTEKADAVRAHIDWRRRDSSPQEKDIIVVEASTGLHVKNVVRAAVTRELGDIVFQPAAPGEYYVYYLPYSADPVQWAYSIQYARPANAADPAWLERNGLTKATPENIDALPRAEIIDIQARGEFHGTDPMEVIATAEEKQALLAKHPLRNYLLFPEDRLHPIRMTDDLPMRWARSGPSAELRCEAQLNEFYVFQIGVYAAKKPIKDLAVSVSDLRTKDGRTIPASAISCLNLGGTDWLGRPVRKSVAVDLGKVAALWFGVQVPKDATPGEYEGIVMVNPAWSAVNNIRLSLKVTDQALEDSGDSELWRLSRLRWLNSTVGLDDEPTAPYTSVEARYRTVKCLGREVRFNRVGFPESIKSGGREILAAPMDLVVETAAGVLKWKNRDDARIHQQAPGHAIIGARAAAGSFFLTCASKTEFDGYVGFRLVLKADKATDVKDIRLEIPIRRDTATYMMGLGKKGGYRPREWKWAWDIERANNMVWIGDADAGLQCKLKGPDDTWDIADLKASGVPKSWDNEGRGGCTVSEDEDRVVVRAYSGERSLRAGEEIEFRFGLLVTPVKPLDPAHWSQRYFHSYEPVERAKAVGATIINIHHATEVNPYINYPFLATEKLSEYVKSAHEQGLKVKIYYTVRELSNHAAEIWALRSLGNEVFKDGPGGGDAWLREHLVSGYTPAWHQPLGGGEVDAAIATTGLSRWHNYYIEGLGWLMKNAGIDGLYLDGIGYNREIMKRVRKVMNRNRPGSLIDFHSGNEFTYNDWRISPANKYMEHFPYIDSLWFGEMYDYDESPDYWLVEVSGIPFGLYGEMLQGGGNPWRGMVYGMTGRYYGGAEPRHIWKVWDDFGIQDAKMAGYWDRACPVRTGSEDILATAYVKKDKVLVSLASWAKDKAAVKLAIDWASLGLDEKKCKLTAPAVPGFQDAAEFAPGDEIQVEPGKGRLLLLEEKE